MPDSETPDVQEAVDSDVAEVTRPARPRPAPAPVPRVKPAPAATEAPEPAAVEVSAAEVSEGEISESISEKLHELEERLAVDAPTAPVFLAPSAEPAAPEVSAAEVSAAEVSASIVNKLHELEERLAVAPPTAAVEAPAARPVKKAPAKKATKAPAKAPVEAPAKKAPVKKAPAKKAAPPTMEIAIPPVPPAPVEALATSPVPPAPVKAPARPRAPRPPTLQPAVRAEPVVPPPTLTEAAPRPIPAPPGIGSGMKAAIALIVLLLAAAAGLGAAAFVEARPSTWESRAIVQLTGGVAAADPVTDRVQGVGKYRLTVANSSFTALSAFKSGLKDDQVRTPIVGLPRGPGQILLVAQADTADHTDALVSAAARNLVEAIVSDQTLRVAAPDERLTPSTPGRIGDAEQLKPADEDAILAGALAAGLVLVLAVLIALLRRRKMSKK